MKRILTTHSAQCRCRRMRCYALAALLAFMTISVPAYAENLTSVAPVSVAPGGTLTVQGQFRLEYIHDRRYSYHLTLYPARGGSVTYLTITRSTASTLTATVPGGVAPGNYSLNVDFQFPGSPIPQQSNVLPVTVSQAITFKPVRAVQQVERTVIASITSITPEVLTPGDRLVIKGRGFGRVQQAGGRKNTILFSSASGWLTIPVQSWSDTMIMTGPINQKPPGGGAVKLHFYRDNKVMLTRPAFAAFHNPKILGYQPTNVRPGDPVTVNVSDIPDDVLLRTRFGVTLMRGRNVLMRIPFEAASRLSGNQLALHIPRNVEGDGLAIALYRKSDSKVVSNLLPGLNISRLVMAPIRKTGRTFICREIPLRFSGGPFIRNGQPLRITAELHSERFLASRTPPPVRVVSATEIEVRANLCVLLVEGMKILFSYPDGTKSSWVPVQVHY